MLQPIVVTGSLVILACSLGASKYFFYSFIFQILAFTLFFFVLRSKQLSSNKALCSLCILSLLIALSSSLLISASYPINWDEGYYLNALSGFIEHASWSVRMWRIPEPTNLVVGGGPGLASWLPFKIASFFSTSFAPSIIALRAFSFATSLLALFLLYQITLKISDRKAALWAVILLASSAIFSRFITARFDGFAMFSMGLLLLMWVTVWFRVKPQSSVWLHMLLGVCCASSLYVHIQLAAYCGGIFSAYCFKYYKLRSRETLHSIVAFLIGALPILGAFYLQQASGNEAAAFNLIREQCLYCQPGFFKTQYVRLKDLLTLWPAELLMMTLLVLFSLRALLNDTFRVFLVFSCNTTIVHLLFFPPHYETSLAIAFFPLLGVLAKELFANGLRSYQALFLTALLTCSIRAGSLSLTRAIPTQDQENRLLVAQCITSSLPNDSTIMGLGPNFVLLPSFINYLELGRGLRYGALLSSINTEEQLQASVWRLITRENPTLFWLGRSDDLEVDRIVQRFLEANPGQYQKITELLYVARSANADQLIECIENLPSKARKTMFAADPLK